MKQIIFDHFRRWRLALILIGAVYFLFADFVFFIPFQSPLNQAIFYVIIFQISIICLGIFLTMDLQRGLARVMTTFPVTTKQVGRAWWLASVAIPAAGLMTVLFLALLVFSVLENKPLPLGSYLAACVFGAPTLGAIFGAMTFTRTAIPETFFDRIGNLFSNLFLMLAFYSLFIFNKTNLNLTVVGLIFAALTILTIIGWFRAGQLVLNRAGFRLASRRPKKQTGQYKTPAGFGGIPFLITKTTGQALFMYLILFAVMLGLNMFLIGDPTLQKIIKNTAGGYNLVFFSILVGIFQVLHICTQLRLLRTLPLSATRLAALLVFLPIASLALLSLILGTFLYAFVGQAEALKVAATFLIPMTFVALAIPLVLWSEFEGYMLTLIVLFFSMSSFLPLDKVPLLFHCAFAIIIVSASFIATKKLLPRRSKAYRFQLSNLGA